MERDQKVQGVKYHELTPFLQCQIDMASIGCISGTLKEWPYLNLALQQLGMFPADKAYIFADMPGYLLKKLCKNIVDKARRGE